MSFEEVEDNVYRIEVPLPENPLRNLNAYLVRSTAANPGGRGRSLLIDNGFNRPECREAIDTALQALDVDITSLDFLVTHLHSDHCGLTHTLLQAAGYEAWVFTNPTDMVHINMYTQQSFLQRNGFLYMRNSGMDMELFNYMVTDHPGVSFAITGPCPFTPVLDGDILPYGACKLRVVETPGHTPGMICLYDADKQMLFSTDHILGDITPNICYWEGMKDSLGSYLRSLKKTAKLNVKLCLTGHRSIMGDCSERITSLEQHHAARLDEIRAILDREGSSTGYTVASLMTWSIRAKSWDDFPKPQRWFACGEAMAHLEHLKALGHVRRARRSDHFFYELAD